jgi:hypothetical protein
MGNMFSNLMASQAATVEERMREWAKTATDEQFEEYERTGMDMSAYRQIREDYRAEQQKLVDANKAAIDMGKLDKYKNIPRSADGFVDAVAAFNVISSDKERQQLEDAPLVYGRVVQANNALFTPNDDSIGATGIVFLFALDEAHRYDEAWLAKTAERISEMKESVDKNEPKGAFFSIGKMLELDKKGVVANMKEAKKLEIVPEDCREFIKALRDHQSSFYFPLGKSLSGDADAWCATYWLDKPSKLPMTFIPYSRIIPFLVSAKPQKYVATSMLGTIRSLGKNVIELIPPEYYTK